jgi:hypothetical protein
VVFVDEVHDELITGAILADVQLNRFVDEDILLLQFVVVHLKRDVIALRLRIRLEKL